MLKITQEELQKLDFCTRGKGKSNTTSKIKEIIDVIKKMQPSDIIKIEKSEWVLKTTPRQRLRSALPGIKLSVLSLTDESGWIVIRL